MASNNLQRGSYIAWIKFPNRLSKYIQLEAETVVCAEPMRQHRKGCFHFSVVCRLNRKVVEG
jgi:hypothetical protein